ATGAARAKTDSELSPDRTRKRECALRAGALVHDRAFATDRIRDGSLSGVAKLARGYRRCAQGRRPRHARKCAATAVPRNSRGRAGRPLGHVARGRVVAHHELRAPEPAGPRFQNGQTLDRSHGVVAGPISRPGEPGSFCRTIATGVARDSWIRGPDVEQHFSALRRRERDSLYAT